MQSLEAETALLHQRVNLAGVQRWNRRKQLWQPLARPTQPLLLVNLWSINCQPCKQEFPRLRALIRAAKERHLGIEFLLIADPPSETAPSEVVDYWTSAASQIPEVDPQRSQDGRLRSSLGGQSSVPITLLVDSTLVVRQAFIGSIEHRNLATAIERLLAALPVRSHR